MKTTTLRADESLLEEVNEIVNSFNYKSNNEFFLEAIKDKVKELKEELIKKQLEKEFSNLLKINSEIMDEFEQLNDNDIL
ncbi:ribbon-helix-helix domain-containing protein [Flammeovirga yaeyamensis]|uniref:Ribbon-helix-helix domain-containing protein n=1 Tax=Flammeovirga yaeyamensis TaxID=367791 RepID=A0AAX1N7V9_9BACT|nr:hypothetical protein [Flammeovirga yaeyamensis]MBB3698951.1 metal-responsive CopG/Arc/MetJ family transcriptional regulator [Flammeovirga yaeyamensis]NMF36385.1 hypothetical protein [Flammeovirga yaeyamensis]QWG03654.1 ribbon-helix-helix domain-containing protein [Flammeovirga yaeyamensis]